MKPGFARRATRPAHRVSWILLIPLGAALLVGCGSQALHVQTVLRFTDLPPSTDPQLAVRCPCAEAAGWTLVQPGQEVDFEVQSEVVAQIRAWQTLCYVAFRYRDAKGEWRADSVLVDAPSDDENVIRIVNDQLYYFPLGLPAPPETTDREGEETGPDRPVK